MNAAFNFNATETWTSTAHGTQLSVFTTANGSTSINENMRLDGSGVLSLRATTSQLDLSAISAGSPNLKITATSDTPSTTWTAGVPSNNPSGYLEILVGANTRYIPFWT